MANLPCRRATKAKVVELLTTALATSSIDGKQVPVTYGWPTSPENEFVAVLRTRGDLTPHDMRAGSLPHEDDFSIDVMFASAVGGTTAAEADERVELLYRSLFSLVRTKSINGANVTGIKWVRMGNVDGPDPDLVDEAFGATLVAELVCHAIYLP